MTQEVFQTKEGVKYLTEPHVVRLASTQMRNGDDWYGWKSEVYDFLEGITDDFVDYVKDKNIDNASQLIKLAGQLCYMSFGEKRTWNKDADKYINHIILSRHGSVLEHYNVTFLFYGISRSLTHELVRHRHFSFSQVSQRYVGPNILRFVERPEYQKSKILHEAFEHHINDVSKWYQEYIESIEDSYRNDSEYQNLSLVERRKALQQQARSVLPNDTEAPIIVTGNLRAWRHFIEERGSKYAEPEIHALAVSVLFSLVEVAPLIFADYHYVDGNIETEYRKV